MIGISSEKAKTIMIFTHLAARGAKYLIIFRPFIFITGGKLGTAGPNDGISSINLHRQAEVIAIGFQPLNLLLVDIDIESVCRHAESSEMEIDQDRLQ